MYLDEDDNIVTMADVPHDPSPKVMQLCGERRVRRDRVQFCGRLPHTDGDHKPMAWTVGVEALEPGGFLDPAAAPF